MVVPLFSLRWSQQQQPSLFDGKSYPFVDPLFWSIPDPQPLAVFDFIIVVVELAVVDDDGIVDVVVEDLAVVLKLLLILMSLLLILMLLLK